MDKREFDYKTSNGKCRKALFSIIFIYSAPLSSTTPSTTNFFQLQLYHFSFGSETSCQNIFKGENDEIEQFFMGNNS